MNVKQYEGNEFVAVEDSTTVVVYPSPSKNIFILSAAEIHGTLPTKPKIEFFLLITSK